MQAQCAASMGVRTVWEVPHGSGDPTKCQSMDKTACGSHLDTHMTPPTKFCVFLCPLPDLGTLGTTSRIRDGEQTIVWNSKSG